MDQNTQSLLIKTAQENLRNNTRSVTLDGEPHKVVRPGDLYPGLWGWDSAFHAIGLGYTNTTLALEQIIVSGLGQTKEGMIPHILFYNTEEAEETYYPAPSVWQNYSSRNLPISGISQPPVHGFALERILKIAEDRNLDTELLQKAFDVAYDSQKWWYSERDPKNSGLVVSVHPWETGRDNSPEWDTVLELIRQTEDYINFPFDPSVRKDIHTAPDGTDNRDFRPLDRDYKMFTYLLVNLRDQGYSIKNSSLQYFDVPFMVEDITINSFLQASNEALLRVMETYKIGTNQQAETLKKYQSKTEESFQNLWCSQETTFQSRDYKTGKFLGTTSASYMSLLSSVSSEQQAKEMASVLNNDKEKRGIKYFVSSCFPDDIDSADYRYWRGPVWSIVNYINAMGFMNASERFHNSEFLKVSMEICKDTIHLVETNLDEQGRPEFHEYHHPVTGDGQGAKNFGFTSVAMLELSNLVLNSTN